MKTEETSTIQPFKPGDRVFTILWDKVVETEIVYIKTYSDPSKNKIGFARPGWSDGEKFENEVFRSEIDLIGNLISQAV